MNDQRRLDEIMLSIASVREQGLQIAPDGWNIQLSYRNGRLVWENDRRCICPLAAVILTHQDTSGPRADSLPTAAARALGTDRSWVLGFVAGFDNHPSMVVVEPGVGPSPARRGWVIAQKVRVRLGMKPVRWPWPKEATTDIT